MFTTVVKYLGTKPKPAMKALEPRFRPEQNQTITRAIFEILKEHGPLSVAQTWERVQEVGVKDLTSKTQMKTVLRWMKERQKLKQICNHVGPNKQFLYTTWFTKPPTVIQPRSGRVKSAQIQGNLKYYVDRLHDVPDQF
ncbi:hypothetical protein L1987_51469 [Smallanthus sonchifolius]|uniref:Uncharacterized protein n=1 Tax=Smallanthus sonchifolius TaxID=185202 RepID=A0ACB9EPS4_9ASTR|nr:hypothetical protein L1987_51469 [Smallanthus sonchifolius]